MANCVKCEKTGSWVKKFSIYKNSTRRLRVCKDCLTLYETVEVTLPERFPKEVTGILEKTAELPTVVPDAGPTLEILDKTLALSMMAGNASAILERLAAIVDQYPLPVIDPDPNPVKAVAIPHLPDGDAGKNGAETALRLISGNSGKDAAVKESPASDCSKSVHAKTRAEAEAEFREAFDTLAYDYWDSVDVRDLADYLCVNQSTVYKRVSRMKDEFTVKHYRVCRVCDEE